MNSYVIIEDDRATVEIIQQIISKHFPSVKFSGVATSITAGLALITSKAPDFIFLDVNLEDGQSFDILKQIPNPDFKVVFITSYSKYAVEAFKFSALDFILKPFEENDIIEVVKKIFTEQSKEDYIHKIEAFFYNYNSTDKKRLVLKNVDKIHVVNVDDIVYIKSDNNYSTFFLKNDKEIIVSKTLKSFEEKLKGLPFLRSHQSYLVNLNLIQSYDKKNDAIVIADNITLPISQSKKHLLNDFLNNIN